MNIVAKKATDTRQRAMTKFKRKTKKSRLFLMRHVLNPNPRSMTFKSSTTANERKTCRRTRFKMERDSVRGIETLRH